jgi:hypothetical protein
MSLEDCVGVITESRLQRFGFAWVHVVHAQFVNVVRRIGAVKAFEGEDHRGATKKRYKCFHIAFVSLAFPNTNLAGLEIDFVELGFAEIPVGSPST